MASSAEQVKDDNMDVDAPAPSVAELAGSETAVEAAAAAAADQAAPADPDEDIFGNVQATPQQRADLGASLPQTASQQQGQVPPSSSETHPQSQQDAKLQEPVSDEASSDAGTGARSADQAISSGFVYDESSGTWFNADLGYYYDASQGLYGDASSGRWYSYTNGAYQPVC